MMVTFGIGIMNDFPLAKTIQLAQLAEKVGFDYFWVADENPAPRYRDVWASYSAVLHNTERIRVATGINTPYTRHPALLAVAMNSYNELFPGRAHLGLGPGGWLPLHPLNIPIWNKPLRAIREAFHIIRELVKGETVTFEGQIFQALDVNLDPKPDQPWEVWLACRGPKMTQLAGELSDGTLLTTSTDYLPFIKEKLKEGAKKSGRTLKDLVIGNFMVTAVSNDRNKVIEKVSHELCFVVPYIPKICHEKTKIPCEEVDQINTILNSQGLEAAAKAVTPEMVDAYSIAGTPDDVIKQVQAHVDAGIEHMIFASPISPDDPVDGVKLLGEQVLPHFRE